MTHKQDFMTNVANNIECKLFISKGRFLVYKNNWKFIHLKTHVCTIP